MRGIFRFLLPCFVPLLISFCSSNNDKDVCAPGVTYPCTCTGGLRGTQLCFSDGSGYEPCVCQGADSGPGDGTAGKSGAAGASGSGGSGGSGGTSSGGSSGATGGTGGGLFTDGGTCPPSEVSSATSGACDLILQDCPSPYTCGVQQSGSDFRSDCVTLGTGTKNVGESCAWHSECQPGLLCAGGFCTRPCCTELESQICGSQGRCTLAIPVTGGGFIRVCDFSPLCTPWTSDCPSGQPRTDCHEYNGDFFCTVPNYDPDAGSTVGAPCTYLEDCGDSQICVVTSADAGAGTCRWLCKVSDSGAPDAGSVTGAPGGGGCVSGQTCIEFDLPWLGYCNP